MNERITVWRALLYGECRQIGLSEGAVRDSLKHCNAWYEAENKSSWVIRAEILDVPVVSGRVIVAERWHMDLDGSAVEIDQPPDAKVPHILWSCPFCGEDHITDVVWADGQQGLWYCERGANDIALVRWVESAASDQPSDEPNLGSRPRRLS